MHRSRWQFGGKRAGSTRKIHAAGSNGIAATTWAAAAQMTGGKSNAGVRCGGTWPKLKRIARAATSVVARDKGRRCCTGRMTRENSEAFSAGSRMSFFVCRPKVGCGHMGVDLRGDQALVAEKLLDAADVGAAV